MKLNISSAIAGAAVLAISGGLIAASAGLASAATTPPWEPDPNSVGSLVLYSCTTPGTPSTCSVETSGNNLNHIADYVQATTPDTGKLGTETGPGTMAFIEIAQPEPNTPTASFPQGEQSGATVFPNATAPYTGANPVATLGSSEADLLAFIGSQVPPTATGYVNIYSLRLYTTSAAGGGTLPVPSYWAVDISVNPTAGTWQVVYPTPVIATTTTLAASPTTATVGQADTLTATTTAADSTNQAGSVAFMNGTTTIGTATVNSSGVATLSYTPTAQGTESLSAVFTPTNTGYSSSTGTLSLTVNIGDTASTTALTVTQDGVPGDAVSLSVTVTPAAVPGTVSFYDNGSITPLNSTPVTVSAGTATFIIPAGLAAGAHSIVADFTPTNPAQAEASQSAPQQFILQTPVTGACKQTGSQCTDVQNIEATVPVGALVLTTPYTASNPLNLGNLALTVGSTLSQYSATAAFNGITVVDTRAGDLPWTVTALASNLTDGGTHPGSTICGQNVGLTGVTSTPGTGFAGTVTATANTAATPPVAPAGGACTGTQGLGGTTPHTVATASAGLGTDVLNGTLTLTAPTSTEPGLFTGTITFTVG